MAQNVFLRRRMTRHAFFSALVLGLLAACNGEVTPTTGSSVTHPTTSTDLTSGTGENATCDSLSAQGTAQLQASIDIAETASCDQDSDCVFTTYEASCAATCGLIVAQSTVSSLQATADAANKGVCATFVANGCHMAFPECPTERGAETPACIAHKCTSKLKEPWTSFSLEADSGGNGNEVPVACSGTSCTIWTVTPDGNVAIRHADDATPKVEPLSAADFTKVNGILGDGFADFTSGYVCTGTGTGVEHVTYDFSQTGFDPVGGDASTCVASNLANPFAALYAVLSTYP